MNIDFGDQDVGSGGALVLPDLPTKTADGTTVAHPKLLLGGGKGAILYLIDHSYLGGLGTGDGTEINPGNNDSNGGDRKFGQINTNSVQEILEATSGGGVFNTPPTSTATSTAPRRATRWSSAASAMTR